MHFVPSPWCIYSTSYDLKLKIWNSKGKCLGTILSTTSEVSDTSLTPSRTWKYGIQDLKLVNEKHLNLAIEVRFFLYIFH